MEALETNLRTEMRAALDKLGLDKLGLGSAIASSPAAGTPPGCSDSPAPARSPGDSSPA